MDVANHYERSPGGILMPKQALGFHGIYKCELVRKGRVVDEWEAGNLVVNQGLNHILDVVFHDATKVSTWYIAPFEGNYTPVATVTAATITAASTECTAYDESTRVAYNEDAPASQSISNVTNRAAFTFNATKTIYGLFMASASAKSATTGTLMSAARFASAKNVEDDDQLLVTYQFNASDNS